MRTAIQTALATLGQTYPAATADKMATLLEELVRWNQRVNLTAIRGPAEMITGHILDSLSARSLIRGSSILDVGTGGGFPGLPLAIVEPEKSFTLIDSNNKKVRFVEHAAGLLGLGNVTVVKVRSEDFAPGNRFDTVIARAVAALPRLVAIAGHHVGEGGVILALKGRYPGEELEQMPDTWQSNVTELEVPGLEAGSRHAVLIEKK
jgi:16S rRNA (guanine527-N7)-methyltransferase